MMLLKIAFRNALRRKRRTILTGLTMLGGLVLCALSIAWSDGTYSYIIDMFTRYRLGHIQIHEKGYLDRPSLYKTIDDYTAIGEKLHDMDGVTSWAPRLYSAGLASVGDKSTGVQIIGIDPSLEERTTKFNTKVIEGKPLSEEPSNQVLLGKSLANILNAGLGDEIVIVSQAADGSIANDMYTITGIVESGEEISDRTSFYLHLKTAQELLVLNDRIHEMVVIVDRLKDVRRIAKRMEHVLHDPDLEISPWQEFARSFYMAMKADQRGNWIALFVIILIVAVGVLNTVLMSVLERRREYGLLKAIGTRPIQIVWLVLLEINIIALASAVIGIGLGLLVNYLLSLKGIPLPESLTYGGITFDRMYTEVNLRSLAIPAITVIVSATLVSIFPAWNAAATEPSKAMRTH